MQHSSYISEKKYGLYMFGIEHICCLQKMKRNLSFTNRFVSNALTKSKPNFRFTETSKKVDLEEELHRFKSLQFSNT